MLFEVSQLSYVYKPFPLDLWVSKLYRSLGIISPEDIDCRKIAYKLGIHLTITDKRCFARDEGNFKLINLNMYLDAASQRKVFFHELCHILRHSGYQYKLMPTSFLELQEWDAKHFTKYAAIPFHMLGFVDWKSKTLVHDMAKAFCVPEEICEYRVQHIYRNMKCTEESVEIV
jgi:Zn-dependent peptidase ImmA (M78 family)